ncbi:PTS glucose transporter subunit IIA [Spiroplasma cantharicola]|uniref:PTS system, beta-glucoside-specific IIABC component n=1 Tax=Spiroplasma cantharicola TaxID=362837 RepID=A0A0M4KEM3_9MOLU|nr:PTS glucose transporter subunit IIABC [Spiroplasma cantharicola]ALD66470.1 PTS system, beta-glucoside-specific IIABC component [Spiroplasma cantharicola]
MEIRLYSPVNGEIKELEKCSDQMFAEKMLGDGFILIPSSNNFRGFTDIATVTMVFETFHAYSFDVDGLQFLVHVGMNTKPLKGVGFTTELEIGNIVNKDDDLFTVDLDYFKKNDLSKETAIVFDINDLNSYKINNLKIGRVKQGDLVCTITYEFISKNEKKILEPSTDSKEFFNISNKYENSAKLINKFVGGSSNYEEVYNCMTRLRFKIKNKSLVNIDELKKTNLVKGTVWNGAELQVIIGQDVYKLKDEVLKLNNQTIGVKNELGLVSEKISITRKMLAMFSGIMAKIIPVMVGAGLIQAIIAILVQTNIMPNIIFKTGSKDGVLIAEANVGWVILFIIGISTSYFMGIVLAVSAANYFKLEGLMGVALGVILCSPLLFGDGGRLGMGNDFLILDLGTINTGNPVLDDITKIRINTMNTKIFVIIGAIYTAKKLDTWLKRVIPVALELMFRPFIVIALVCPLAFFGYGIAWNFFETLFGSLIFYIGKIPIGIGVGIFVGLWQVAVIFGLHMMLGIIVMIDNLANGGHSVYGISSISVWAQVGALIGVILVTQNAKLKKEAIGMLPAGFLGITEPILYGINLPKKRPLVSGVAAAFLAGAIASLLNVTKRANTGIGVFQLIGFFAEPQLGGTAAISPIENGLFYLLACIISISLAVLFSMMSYKERASEKTLLTKTIKSLITFAQLELNLNKDEVTKIKEELNQTMLNLDKTTLKLIKATEKNIQNWLKVKEKLNSVIEKEDSIKTKIIEKGKILIAKSKFELADIYKIRYQSIDNSKVIAVLEEQIDQLFKQIDLDKLNESIINIERTIIKKIYDLIHIKKSILKDVENIIFNNLNSVQIYYNLLKSKEENINLNLLIANLKQENLKQIKR